MRSALLVALALTAAGAAQAQPVVRETVKHYAVTGATEAAVRASLEDNPIVKEKKHRVGTTAADIQWQPRFSDRDGRCRVRSVKVTVTIVTTLPDWAAPPEAPAALRASWQRFLAALTAHEAGHAAIAVRTAERIEDELWRASSARSCDGYGAKLNAIANALFDAAEQEQRAYDAETGYGAKQGVSFP